jgi:hypothetical protein
VERHGWSQASAWVDTVEDEDTIEDECLRHAGHAAADHGGHEGGTSVRIRCVVLTALITVGLFGTVWVSPAHADDCGERRPGAPEMATKAHTEGGIEIRVTYNYATCSAYASLSNRNNNDLGSVDMKLWSVGPGKCPSAGSNGTKLAEWNGTLERHRIQTTSAPTPAGDCFRVTVWLGGNPWDGEQVFAPRY